MTEVSIAKEEVPDNGWTDSEIETFNRRAARFVKGGMNDMEAEGLAQAMLYRDRPESGDDRRICLECKRFVKGRCSHGLPALWRVLQRCESFALRGAA